MYSVLALPLLRKVVERTSVPPPRVAVPSSTHHAASSRRASAHSLPHNLRAPGTPAAGPLCPKVWLPAPTESAPPCGLLPCVCITTAVAALELARRRYAEAVKAHGNCRGTLRLPSGAACIAP
jgi:hypothetical protein